MTEKMIVACPDCRTRFVAPLEKFLPDGRKVRCAKCGHSWFQQPERAEAAPQAPMAAPAPPAAASAKGSIMDRAAEAASSASVIERADQRRAELEAAKHSAGTTSIQEIDSALEAEHPAKPTAGYDETTFGHVGAMPQTEPVRAPAPRRAFWPRALFYTAAAAVIAGVAGYFFKDPLSAQFPSLAPKLSSWHDTVDGVVAKAIPSKRTLRIENVKYDFEEIDGGKALLVSAEVINEDDKAQDAPKLTMSILGDAGAVLSKIDLAPEDLTESIEPQDRAPYFIRVPHPPEGLERVEVDFAE